MARTHEVTLTANVVTSYQLDEAYTVVKLVNLTGGPVAADPVWFTGDGTTPTVGGDNCLVLPAVYGAEERVSVPTGNPASESTTGDGPVINLICAAAATVLIEGGY
jgi:hypothetical protein